MGRLVLIQWHPVEERLPPCASTVLVYVPQTGRRLRAFYLHAGCDFGTGWHEDTAYGDQPAIAHPVSHWAELPAAPVSHG